MKALLIWFATLGLVLSFLGFLAVAHERRAVNPVDPSIYTNTIEPELPAIPEAQPEAPEIGPALTY